MVDRLSSDEPQHRTSEADHRSSETVTERPGTQTVLSKHSDETVTPNCTTNGQLTCRPDASVTSSPVGTGAELGSKMPKSSPSLDVVCSTGSMPETFTAATS